MDACFQFLVKPLKACNIADVKQLIVSVFNECKMPFKMKIYLY